MLFLVPFSLTSGQNGYETKVKLVGLSNKILQDKLQENITKFLSELNIAFSQKRFPQVDEEILTPKGGEVLFSLWDTSPFRCIETEIVAKVVQMMSKREKTYQVRISLILLQNVFKTGDDTSKNHYQEICLTIDSVGMIENIFYSLGSNIYNKLLNESIDLADKRRREFILEFIQDYRTAYYRKDIDFLSNVFSNTNFSTENISFNSDSSGFSNLISEYQKYQEVYLQIIKDVILKQNKYLNIVFEEIRISRDRIYPEIYGINLKQNLSSKNYKDIGYLFFMIDFGEEQNPIFLVRTWQPEEAKDSEEGVFNLNSFEIVR